MMRSAAVRAHLVFKLTLAISSVEAQNINTYDLNDFFTKLIMIKLISVYFCLTLSIVFAYHGPTTGVRYQRT